MEKKQIKNVVILANGQFPGEGRALQALREADLRVCCDGAAHHLMAAGWEPDLIIGDLDSLSPDIRERYAWKVVRDTDQESNDLTKAVRYCVEKGYRELTVVGATGLREDHSLGNISLLVEYAPKARVQMITDYGEFFLVNSGEEVPSRPGEQISIFSLDNQLEVTGDGLLYPLERLRLSHWYTASLNQATGSSFSLKYDAETPLIIFRSFG